MIKTTKYNQHNILYVPILADTIIVPANIDKIDELTRGYLVWQERDACIEVIALSVATKYTGQKYGTKLLRELIHIAKNGGYSCINLDDMSSNAWKPHNIYVNCGFSYKNAHPFPEMELILNM